MKKEEGFSSQKLRINLRNKGIFMSELTIKRIVKGHGLSNGNKMEGIKLKWIRFERENPTMWQIDGIELADGRQLVIVEDDCSRYCIGAMIFDSLTTDNMILLLEKCIAMRGKPRELLTDNGHEFRGVRGNDSEFDKWCEKQRIIHIRSGIHKATTLRKIGAIQQTYFREIVYCNNDLEAWRYRYNHERPHESLRMLTPAVVYFQYKRHKKHYDL